MEVLSLLREGSYVEVFNEAVSDQMPRSLCVVIVVFTIDMAGFMKL